MAKFISLTGMIKAFTLLKAKIDLCAKSADLATVATSGLYQDLTGKPNVPTVDQAITQNSGNPVRSSAIYSALQLKSNTGHTHDDRYYTESEIITKLAGKAASVHTHDDRYYTETEVDALIAAATGADLSAYLKKEDVESALDDDSVNPVQNKVLKSALDDKSDTGHTHAYSDITGTPTVPTVANGTFTASIQTGAGSYLNVKQIGDAVFLQGGISTASGTFNASGVTLGTVTGVSAPSVMAMIPVLTYDGTNFHPALLSVLDVLGVITLQLAASPDLGTDSMVIINGHYFA